MTRKLVGMLLVCILLAVLCVLPQDTFAGWRKEARIAAAMGAGCGASQAYQAAPIVVAAPRVRLYRQRIRGFAAVRGDCGGSAGVQSYSSTVTTQPPLPVIQEAGPAPLPEEK